MTWGPRRSGEPQRSGRVGEGVHHLTFRVDNIEDSAAAAESAGYRTIGLDTSREDWKEVFLHPASAHGTLIEFGEWPDGPHDSDQV